MTTQPAFGMTHGYSVGGVIVATVKEALAECAKQGHIDIAYVPVNWAEMIDAAYKLR